MTIGLVAIVVWFLACAWFSWYVEHKEANWTPDPEKWGRLLTDDLPPMKGVQSDGHGGWEKF